MNARAKWLRIAMNPEGDESMAGGDARIACWLQPQEILLDVEVRDRSHALKVMADVIALSHGLDPSATFRALWRREQAESTGLGGGFAIPHARIRDIARPLTLFMRTKVAVPFDAPDGQPVSDILAILVPANGAKDDHLRMLAMVSRLFSNSSFRRKLDAAPNVRTAVELFRSAIATFASDL